MRVTIASQLTPDLLGVARRVVVEERARGAEAGVVDQQVDLDSELRDLVAQRGGLGREVAGDQRGPSVGSSAGELLQPVGAAGDQDQVVAAGGELAGELFADSRGSAGDQCGFGHRRDPILFFEVSSVSRASRQPFPRRLASRIGCAPGRASTCGTGRRRRTRRSAASPSRTARSGRRSSATATGSCTRRRSGGSSTRRRCSSRRRATTTGRGSRTRSRRAASRGRWRGRWG